ncbi:tetratricopeptide repeat protein [Brasilonema sp. UFV-L1]|uniref:tetratricopeptide repeat protein n=1 Tax=Brasilonema sp. UFV-L1 TaxID=2234130 RepID=UPI00145D1A96|nr:tetratricopeptide repeat protein [Brasilonema sp. UFV-L1]NMG10189.1 hypothetical protein [Brasilonema sp. UFV-L1]
MNSFQTKQSSLKDEAVQLLNEGVEQYERGEFQQALETYQRVLAIFQEIGEKANVEFVLNNIALVYSRFEQSEKTLLRTLDISGQESNPPIVRNPRRKKK